MNSEWFQYWNKPKQKKKSSSILTGVKHTKTMRPGGRCLNRETPDKSARFGKYVVISHPLCPPPPPPPHPPLLTITNYTYQKARLLKRNCYYKAKQKAFLSNNVNIEARETIQAHKKKLKEHYTRFKMITFPMEMYFQMFS